MAIASISPAPESLPPMPSPPSSTLVDVPEKDGGTKEIQSQDTPVYNRRQRRKIAFVLQTVLVLIFVHSKYNRVEYYSEFRDFYIGDHVGDDSIML